MKSFYLLLSLTFPARPSGASRSDLTYEAENITLQLIAIVELLEERGIMTRGDVLKSAPGLKSVLRAVSQIGPVFKTLLHWAKMRCTADGKFPFFVLRTLFFLQTPGLFLGAARVLSPRSSAMLHCAGAEACSASDFGA